MAILDHLARPSAEFSRHFVKNIDFGQWESIEPYFVKLEQSSPETALHLEAWIGELNELESILAEEASRRYIAMTVDTTDQEAARAFQYFVEEIEPKIAPWSDRLQRKLIAHPQIDHLSDFYWVWKRDVKSSIELFREENIPIETEIALEIQAYQQVTGAQTVTFEGEIKTLAQMSPYLEDQNRDRREAAWRAIAGRRFQDRKTLNQHMNSLMAKRQKISRNCGFDSFIDYIFKAKGRYDYSSEQCFAFHKMVEELIVPLQKDIHRRRAASLGLERLRPWDTACDPFGRPPLQPFKTSEELIQGVDQIFERMDKTLSKHFKHMRSLGLLDLDARAGKAPGGYQCSLDELRFPFIFMNASGTVKDVFTLLHEAGHSFHLYLSRDVDLRAYRDVPAEIAEVASMSMELFGMDALDVFFSPEEMRRAQVEHLEDIILLLPWVAAIDAFQHWLYTHSDCDDDERDDYWMELCDKFGGEIDWTGLEAFQAAHWQRQLHLFEVPFYYIEYGFSQIAALGLWRQYRQDKERALDHYFLALSRGSSLTLPELYAKAGVEFDFSSEIVAPLLEDIHDFLAQKSQG